MNRIVLGLGLRAYACAWLPNDLDLDSSQQLLAFLKCPPDLLRRQVGNWPGDRANVVRDWRGCHPASAQGGSSISLGWPSMPIGGLSYPCAPLTLHSQN
jgi:hypothetical protein